MKDYCLSDVLNTCALALHMLSTAGLAADATRRSRIKAIEPGLPNTL